MKPTTSMHARFSALTAPHTPAQDQPPPLWYEPAALEILLRVTLLATADEFRLKEQELGAVFARLSVPESRTLHKRLGNPGAADHLARAFSRLVPERRGRLLTFLADARRREARGQTARFA